jgi:hypothetical protein
MGVTQRIFSLDEPAIPTASQEASSDEDFELVVGRRQIAALTFLALVIVAVCSGGSYLAGKAISSREAAADQPEIKIEQPPPQAASTPLPAPMLEATVVPATAVPKANAEAPLFENPNPQAIYIQVGAVEKGVAVILAEGLRKHALDSFVAPGPSTKSFRVLIGPFRDVEAYQKARNIVAEIGLDSFARRYQSQ